MTVNTYLVKRTGELFLLQNIVRNLAFDVRMCIWIVEVEIRYMHYTSD